MKRAALLFGAVLLPTISLAGTFSTTGPLLSPDDSEYYANGVGAPTLTYDGGSWNMFFETKLTDSYVAGMGGDFSACGAVWAIGQAQSTSLNTGWAVVGSDPVIVPVRGTYYECKVTHPKIVKDGSTWYMFFKANQDKGLPASCGRSWGCSPQTGVGVITITSMTGVDTNHSFTLVPVLNVSGFGFPSAVKVDSDWYLWVAQLPNMYLAKRFGSPTGSFTLVPSPVLLPGSNAWTPDRVGNPAVTCIDGTRYPFQAFLGGKNMSGSTELGSGIGEATSVDGQEFFLSSAPDFSWGDATGWRHWDLHRFEGDNACDQGFNENYVAVYAQKDGNNENEIHLAFTSLVVSPNDFNHKVCSNSPVALNAQGQAFDISGDDYLEDDYSQQDLYDTGLDAAGGCNSASPLAPAGLLAFGLPFLLITRRRRD